MPREIPSALRLRGIARASGRCEYCLLHQDDSFTPHQIDHIVSRKHGGTAFPDNLALACIRCNAWKGSDIASVGFEMEGISRLFHPRRDRWQDYFHLEGAEITPLTTVGAATIRLLRLNLPSRIAERRALMQCARYPRDEPVR